MELRLGLAMRGGVSLAVWMGGACGEIDELRRGEIPFWDKLSKACGFDRVVVDVLAGASAGGLNGVLFAGALRHGYRMADLGSIWVKLGSVGELRRSTGPWISIFNGDEKFLIPVHTQLSRLIAGQSATRDSSPTASYIDLQLTATLVNPLEIPVRHLEDEELWARRSSASFRFRHESQGVDPKRDLEDDEAALWRLALAARATSSFPVAFEAANVNSARPKAFGDPPSRRAGAGVDCRGVFSEATTPSALDQETGGFVVADGGIVDNIPLGRTIESIAGAPANCPTARVLIYLHPSGPPVPRGRATRSRSISDGGDPPRGVRAVIRGLIAAKLRDETIDGDLEQLEAHNRAVLATRITRRSALDGAMARAEDESLVIDAALFAAVWHAYVDNRGAAEANAVRKLLDDPLAVVGADPFPLNNDENRWRAPLSLWPDADRIKLHSQLTEAVRGHLLNNGPDAMFTTGTSALNRVVAMLLEWVRAKSDGPQFIELKAKLYRYRSIVMLLHQQQNLAWVTAMQNAPTLTTGLVADSMTLVDDLARVPQPVAEGLISGEQTADEYLHHASVILNSVLTGSGEELTMTALFRTTSLVGSTAPTVDLRQLLLEHIVDDLSQVMEVPSRVLARDHSAALLDHLLSEAGGCTIKDRLICLEIEGLQEELNGGIDGEEISLYRISAAARTPFAGAFEKLRQATVDESTKPGGWDPRSDDPNYLRASTKLAGNELANFSAFLDSRWRENDWMWGRLDAASDLIHILISKATEMGVPDLEQRLRDLAGMGAGEPLEAIKLRLIELRQQQILDELLVPGTNLGEYDLGLEKLTRHGSTEVAPNMAAIVVNTTRVLRHTLRSPFAFVLAPIGIIGGVVTRLITHRRTRRGPDPFLK